MRRRIDPRRIKVLRTYTVEEAADLLGVHKNTIRAWVKGGLEPLDRRRPTLFVGGVLAAYIRRIRDQARRPCPPGHFYCLRCRDARRPAGGIVEVQPAEKGATHNVQALCCVCLTVMNRRSHKHEGAPKRECTSTPDAGAPAPKEVDLAPLKLSLQVRASRP